ncbi:hypothetical protein, partial [Streptomyces flavofungini]|uniref:hypothetical protein n=1 Tax=Streptomyces flavofungini TaxID=68200 RepID=UPI0034DF1EDF
MSTIRHGFGARPSRGGYALRLTARDELLHLYWGPRVTLRDAEALAAGPPPPARGFESPLDGREEY